MQLEKLGTEISKLSAKHDRLIIETRWYPLVVVGAFIAAVIALTKLFLTLRRVPIASA